MSEGSRNTVQQLKASLSAVEEDKIVGALRSSFDLLRQACQGTPAGASGGNTGETQGVQFRVTCCCLVLQRAATLVSCSDLLLPEVIAVLQEKLHAAEEVRSALLELHLAELLRVPPAFELTLRSFPCNPHRLAQFYAHLLAALPQGSQLLSPAGMLAAHVRRELQKLTSGPTATPAEVAAIDFAPHLPWLLQLALRTCSSSPGAALTLDSCVSESTALQSGSGEVRPRPAIGPGLCGGVLPVKAAAACLRVLRDPNALLRHLGMARQQHRESEQPPAAADCLAMLIGGAEKTRKEESKGDRLATAIGVVETLMETMLLSPQAALAIENVARSQADSEHTVVPVSAASNAGATGRRLPVPSSPVVARKAAEQEQTLLDLLSLHEALVALQGRSADNGGAPPRNACLLSAPALLGLARLALRQLETGGGCDSSNRRSTTRTCTPSNLRSTDGKTCVPPRVATHLLTLLTSARSDLEDATDAAHLALDFTRAAFKGPQLQVAYRVSLASAIAVRSKRSLDADDSADPPPAAPTPSAHEGDARQAKRVRVEAPAAAPVTPRAITKPAVGVGPPPPRGFSRLKPWPGSTDGKACSSEEIRGPTEPQPRPQPQPQPSVATQTAKPAPRRITPTPVPAEEAEQASVEAGILDSLALQKDEYDAYWEHYIAVKEELVATVLQDDPGGEDGIVPDEEPAESSPQRRKSKSAKARRSEWSSSVNFNPAFREPEWQDLHAAALRLLTDSLQDLDGENEDADPNAVWQVLERESVWLDHKQMALLGSRIVDPSVTAGRRLSAAKLGAKELPHECLVLGLATRMVQYCIGPGAPVSPGLAAGFLRLLRQLMARCVEEAESVAAPEGADRLIRPLELAGGALLACVERGWLRCSPLNAEALTCLLRCTLPAVEPPQALQLAAAAMWGSLQARPGEAPAWLPSSCHSWLEMWTRLPSPEHVRAVCTELLSQAPHLLAELHEGECTEPQSTRNANARLKAQAGVAAALAGFCDAVVGRGKGVATGAALRDCLLAAAMLLQAAAAACESLAQQLRCPRPKPLHTPGTGRGKKGRGRRHRSMTPAAVEESPGADSLGAESPGGIQEEVGSVRALAGLAGAGSSLAAAAGKLLDWRQQKCPGRAREPAAALADLRGIFAESWRRLDVTRSSHTALEDVEVGLWRTAGDPQGSSDLAKSGGGSEELRAVTEEKPGECSAPKQAQKSWRPQNAYLRAAMAEDVRLGADSEDDSGYSDLEDFIVCKPGRDYGALIAKEFKYKSSRAEA